MSRFYKNLILLILVLGVIISLFIKFQTRESYKKQEKMGKVNNQFSSKQKKKVVGEKESTKELPKIILITNSGGCMCSIERCQEVEFICEDILKKFSGKIDYKIIDYEENPEKVSKLVKQHKIIFLPALLFFDKKGKLKNKIEGFIDKSDIEKALLELGFK